MKICTACHKEFPDDFFTFKNRKLGIRRSWCRNCTRIIGKKYYLKNKDYYKRKAAEHTKKIRKEIKRFLWDYLKDKSCKICGESNPIVLDFHHRDPSNKIDSISNFSTQGYSIVKLKEEIKKCDILCANCHRIKTAEQFGWYNEFL